MSIDGEIPRVFLDVSYNEIVKTKEIIEERHVEHSCYSRQTSWITEKYLDGVLIASNLVLGPLTFIDYSFKQ